MLIFDATDAEQRLVHSVWYELVVTAKTAAQAMGRLEIDGCEKAAAQLDCYANSIEQSAQRQLNALAKRVEPRPYAETPRVNGHAHEALEDSSNQRPTNGVHEQTETALGSPREEVDDAPAMCDEVVAADGGPETEEPAIKQASQDGAADLLTAIEKELDLVREMVRVAHQMPPSGIIEQDIEIAEKQLYVIRNEARDPRMRDSARMKFDAVLKLLKGT